MRAFVCHDLRSVALSRHLGNGRFYSRRLKRVLVPLIVWSLALPLLYFGYFAAGVQTASPNIVMDTYTWSATVGKLYTFFFNFNYDTTPLWYVYMLVGLYLFMPS